MRCDSIVAKSLFLKVPFLLLVSRRYADVKLLRAAARVMSAKPRQSPDSFARSYLDDQGGTLNDQVFEESASVTATLRYIQSDIL